MRIDVLRCDEDTELHILARHNVTLREVKDAVYQRGLVLKGRTEAGRYLTIIVRYLGDSAARLITARDMSWTERRRYERHTAH